MLHILVNLMFTNVFFGDMTIYYISIGHLSMYRKNQNDAVEYTFTLKSCHSLKPASRKCTEIKMYRLRTIIGVEAIDIIFKTNQFASTC